MGLRPSPASKGVAVLIIRVYDPGLRSGIRYPVEVADAVAGEKGNPRTFVIMSSIIRDNLCLAGRDGSIFS